jgi:hypothetical protein
MNKNDSFVFGENDVGFNRAGFYRAAYSESLSYANTSNQHFRLCVLGLMRLMLKLRVPLVCTSAMAGSLSLQVMPYMHLTISRFP